MKTAVLIILAVALAGCTSVVQQVRPLPPGTQVKTIFLQHNPRLLMKEFVPEVASQIRNLGYEVEMFSGDAPKHAKHVLTVTANWNWDLAMYLTYFHAELEEEGVVIATVEYDSKAAGLNPDKFGRTADKIRPLLEKLLNQSSPPSSS